MKYHYNLVRTLLSIAGIAMPMLAAAETFTVGQLTYETVSPTEVSLTHADEEISGALEIPAAVSYLDSEYSVTSIGKRAFDFCPELTTVTIPDSVTEIGDEAFGGCHYLSEVKFGNSVKSIGNAAFRSCYLSSLTLPESLVTIGDDAFPDLMITTLTIPDAVTTIGDNAFWGVHFSDLTIGKSVNYIGHGALSGCVVFSHLECKAPIPPTVFYDTFTGAAYVEAERYADDREDYLTVPAASRQLYKDDPVWGKFLPEPHYVTEIRLNPTVWSGEVGSTFRIDATVLPENAYEKWWLVWMSSDESIATVEDLGAGWTENPYAEVTVHKEGQCEIRVVAIYSLDMSVEAVCKIDVTTGVTSVGADSDTAVSVYTLDGTCLHADTDSSILDHLSPGIYLIRQGDEVRKLAIR